MSKQLTSEERERLAQLHHRGENRAEIARQLDRHSTTISRELRRNGVAGGYLPVQAHERAQERRRRRPLTRKMDRPDTGGFVRRGLEQRWSPEQIAGRLRREHPDDPQRWISATTIYAWIAAQEPDERRYWRGFLRRRGRRPRVRKNPASGANRAAIADRPAAVERRERLGDFEGDTLLGSPGTGGLVTLVDRKSRYAVVAKVQSKKADYVARRIRTRLETLPADKRRSLTFDNGREFARVDRLERRFQLAVYFAEPGRPYQRGTNENTNGLIRQFFPKGQDFRYVSPQDAKRSQDLLNHRPRACLDYRTPHEVFFEEAPPDPCS